MPAENCPFCNVADDRVITSKANAVAIADEFPVARGHSLVFPKKHVDSIFQLKPNELVELWQLVTVVREILSDRFDPDGFNIGVNDGEAAGQTIQHAHIHIIPRYKRDVTDPRGGIRWVIHSKAQYW
jgi:diadenosine tetraphosphate (Ap4A) HIT family hydrolase